MNDRIHHSTTKWAIVETKYKNERRKRLNTIIRAGCWVQMGSNVKGPTSEYGTEYYPIWHALSATPVRPLCFPNQFFINQPHSQAGRCTNRALFKYYRPQNTNLPRAFSLFYDTMVLYPNTDDRQQVFDLFVSLQVLV